MGVVSKGAGPSTNLCEDRDSAGRGRFRKGDRIFATSDDALDDDLRT